MDLRSTLARAIAWRWMPTVAPVAGTLTFVVLCIAIVPDDFGSMTGPPSSKSAARDKIADPKAAPAESDDHEVDGEGTDTAPRTPHKHATPLPAKVTTRTTDTVRSLFRKVDPAAADSPEPPIQPPPPPGGPAPIVAVPDAPPLPPVSNLPGADPADDPNPDTGLPR